MSFEVLRLLHTAATILLLGHVTVTGFWGLYLFQVRDTVPFRQFARGMLWADFIFGLGGGMLLIVTGILLAQAEGIPFPETRWLVRAAAALGLALLLWGAMMVPDQARLVRIPADDRRGLRRVFRRWIVVRCLVAGVLFYGLITMVTRS